MVTLKNVDKSYKTVGGSLTVLKGFNITINKGKITSLVGPSGCGKTTVINMMAGILRPDSGQIIWGKTAMPDNRPIIGLVSQTYGLLPWKTVWENIIMGMDIARIGRGELKKRGEYMLSRMGLYSFKDYYPNQLSGGQRQRVALGRVFALKPALILMDEPFSALDAFTREDMQMEFLSLWKEFGMTVLMVTHDIEEAIFVSEKIAIMNKGSKGITKIFDNPFFGIREYVLKDGYPSFKGQVKNALRREKNGKGWTYEGSAK